MPDYGEPISERELDVLNCLAEGASNREIADRLSISHHTVKVHVRNIFAKLGVSSRTEATTVALQRGMLVIPGYAHEAAADEAADDPVAPQTGDGHEAATGGAGLGQTPEEGPEAHRLPAAGDEEVSDAARPTSQAFSSRRVMLAVIGLLSVLVLVLAVNSLLRGDAQTPPAQTTTAGGFVETEVGQNWVASRAMPQARARMALATVGLHVYAIGGESAAGVDNRVLIFDSQQREWREGAQKLTAVASAAAGVLGGEIYVAGGYGANGEATAAVEAYSPLNNAWRTVTALPRPTAGALAIVSDELLYLFGGENGEQVLADSLVYDPGTQQWQTLPPMPTARAYSVGGALGGKLVVVGGRDDSGPLAVCAAYDPTDEAWLDCPPPAQPRAAAGSAIFLNKLYVLGGMMAEDGAYGEVYDPAEQTWSEFSIPMLADRADWPHLGVSNVETHIYAVGGEQNGQISDALYVYRPLVHTFFIPAAPAGGGN